MELQDESSSKRRRVENEAEFDSSIFGNAETSTYVLKVSERQYLDETTADVYIECGTKGERIPAHKSVLSRANDVFYALLHGEMTKNARKDEEKRRKNEIILDFLGFCKRNKQSIENVTGEFLEEYHKSKNDELETGEKLKKSSHTAIKLPATSPETMKDFLQFCYKGKVNLKMENITQVISVPLFTYFSIHFPQYVTLILFLIDSSFFCSFLTRLWVYWTSIKCLNA